MATNRQMIFLLKCIESNGIKFDFATVGSATGMTPNAARMRYTRLRSSLQEYLKHIEPTITAQTIRSSSKSVKTFVGQKRRLSTIEESEESDDYNADNQSHEEIQDECPPLKKRLRSATQQQTSNVTAQNGSINSSRIDPSDPTAFVDLKMLKATNRPEIRSEISHPWAVLATDPRKRIDHASSHDAGAQLKAELMDDIKRTLAENGGSIDDLVRMNIEKSTHIFPSDDPAPPKPSIAGFLGQENPFLWTKESVEIIKANPPPPIPDYEAQYVEYEFEYDYDDNIDSEVVQPRDSLSEVIERNWMADYRKHMRQKRIAEIQAARNGRLNKIISFFLRRGGEEEEEEDDNIDGKECNAEEEEEEKSE